MAKKKTTKKAAGSSDDQAPVRAVTIPRLEQAESELWLIGDRPLMVNNKLTVAESIAEQYGGPGGKAGTPAKTKPTPDEQYVNAFYALPDSPHDPPHPKAKYGIPASGIRKCACSAIRTTGLTDNTTIGLIGKSFSVMADAGGLCLLQFKKLERDVRPVNIGSGGKTVPDMRHRPMFHDWKIKIRVRYNPRVLTPEQLVNLFMHAGQYIGLCELREEKKQGECGGFVVKGTK